MSWCKGFWLLAGLALLPSCTGGGSSSPASAGSGSQPAPMSMTLSTQQLALSAQVSDPAPVATVTIQLSGVPSNTLYIGVNSARAMLNDVSVSGSTSTSATCALTFVSPSSLPPGTYLDTLTIGLFYDAQGATPIGNSPLDVAVTYTVSGSSSPDFPSTSAGPAQPSPPLVHPAGSTATGHWQTTLEWPAPRP